jgi:hypothetical protein
MVEESVMDTTTNAVAGAAIVSPWWLAVLNTGHDLIAWLLPFMGFTWLAIQMYYKLKKERKA